MYRLYHKVEVSTLINTTEARGSVNRAPRPEVVSIGHQVM